jgi:hypothetical protein
MSHNPILKRLLPAALALLLTVTACNIPVEEGPLVVDTGLEAFTSTPSPTRSATPTPTSTPADTATDTPTLESSVTASATIAHTLTPGAPPSSWLSEINDHDSSITASQRRTTAGESFPIDLFERPFNAETMDVYFPDLDIKRARLSMDGTWIFVTIQLVGPGEGGGLGGNYGLEVDLNLDGRGDMLLLASAPQAAWSTDGVQVWKDNNHDVGSSHPLLADVPADGRDGYETLVFYQGQGSDPDAAWAQLLAGDPAGVRLAFKKSLIQNDGTFLWGAWADQGVFEPGWYDYNDHFTHNEAGSPLQELTQYPNQALFEIDNTCRWAVGFTPTGVEPGLCPLSTIPLKTPTRTATPTATLTKTPGGPSLTPTRTPTRSNTPPGGVTNTPTWTRSITPFQQGTTTTPSRTPTRTPTPTQNCVGAAANVCTPTRTPTPTPTTAGVPGGAAPNGR